MQFGILKGLIHIGLQPGDWQDLYKGNRLNGFQYIVLEITALKRGVNEMN